MRVAELVALGVGWSCCTVLPTRHAGLLGYWAALVAALAGSTLVMHLPQVLAQTGAMTSQDQHLLAVAVAVPCSLPSVALWLRARRRRRPARHEAEEALIGRHAVVSHHDSTAGESSPRLPGGSSRLVNAR